MARLASTLRGLPRILRSAGAQRARWGIIDQAISSFTNFAVTAVVAHQVDPNGFGDFSVALATYICVLWMARSMVGEPFVVRFTTAPAAEQVGAAQEAVGASVLIGLVTGATAVLLGRYMGNTGIALITMGAFLPALLAQDAIRYVLMAGGRSRSAAANDGTWLVVQTIIIAALLTSGRASVATLIAAFGTGALAGSAFGLWQLGAPPSLRLSLRWLRKQADLWVSFLLELLTVNATPQLSMLAVGATGDVVAVGAARAGLLMFAPLSVIFSGFFLVGLPEAVRFRSQSLAALRVFLLSLAGSMSLLTVVWAGTLAALPGNVGRAVLGANWSPGRQLLWSMAAFTAACSCILAGVVGLRALGVARQSLRVRIWAGPVVIISGIVGAELGSSTGMALGLAGSSWLSAGLTWIVIHRALDVARKQEQHLSSDVSASNTSVVRIDDPVPLVGEWA